MKQTTININNFDNHLLIRAMDQSNLIDHVPAMVYKATFTPQGLVLLKDRPSFSLPQLRFGKHNRHFRTITETYDRTGPSVGVLLCGEKGSGKSLMAEELSNWAIRQDIPVVLVTEAMSAEALTTIIRAIGPCVVYFDEFGKTYHDVHERANLLTLFSDTSFIGTMFIITGNSHEEFSSFIYHRPQRFKFAIDYHSGLDKECFDDIMKVMNVDEKFHEYLRIYAQHREGTLNIDSFLTVVRQTASCQDEAELIEACEILNVPRLPRKTWNISKVTDLTERDGTREKLDYGFRVHFELFSNSVYLEEVEEGSGLEKTSTRELVTLPESKQSFKMIIDGLHSIELTFVFDYEKDSTHLFRKPKGLELIDALNNNATYTGHWPRTYSNRFNMSRGEEPRLLTN